MEILLQWYDIAAFAFLCSFSYYLGYRKAEQEYLHRIGNFEYFLRQVEEELKNRAK